MKVLVVSAPPAGHLFPLLPAADAGRDAGHEVRPPAAGEVRAETAAMPAPASRAEELVS